MDYDIIDRFLVSRLDSSNYNLYKDNIDTEDTDNKNFVIFEYQLEDNTEKLMFNLNLTLFTKEDDVKLQSMVKEIEKKFEQILYFDNTYSYRIFKNSYGQVEKYVDGQSKTMRFELIII